MANIREIRSRIRGVKSTQQITKAMKMVSVSKLRKTQANMGSVRLFSDRCISIMGALQRGDSGSHPLFQARPAIQKVTYVILVGNRGLCGAYNSNLVRYLELLLANEKRPCEVIVIGRWTSEALNRMPVVRTYELASDTPDTAESDAILQDLKQRYLSGQTDQVYLIYQRYVNALRQEPTRLSFMPAASPDQANTEPTLDYQYEPDQETILDKAVSLYLSSTLYRVLLEARSAEHSARTTAMGAASDNIDELIEQLSLELNRARQAQITTEISEIAGGASALEKKKA